MRRLAWSAAVLGLILATTLPAVVAAAGPRTPFAVAVVFPPWWDAQRIEAASAALGQLARRGALDNIVVIYGDATLTERARDAGALLLLDPTVPGAC
jgi:hypothetical protein